MDQTFPSLVCAHSAKRPHAAAMREKEFGIWQVTTWQMLETQMMTLAAGLQGLGVQRGDHVVVIGANRPRLYAAMLAIQALGGIAVPLYQDAAAAECVFPIQNADVKVAIVEDQEQVDKMLEVREQVPTLAHILYHDPRGLRHYDAPGLASLTTCKKGGRHAGGRSRARCARSCKSIQPDDVAAMFFTSGTTGNPKGVVHTHFTLLDRARVGSAFDHLTHDDEVLAYLPPAWIGQNIFSFAQWLVQVTWSTARSPRQPSKLTFARWDQPTTLPLLGFLRACSPA